MAVQKNQAPDMCMIAHSQSIITRHHVSDRICQFFAFTPQASATVLSMQAQPVQGFNMAYMYVPADRQVSIRVVFACLSHAWFQCYTHPERNAAAAKQVGMIE